MVNVLNLKQNLSWEWVQAAGIPAFFTEAPDDVPFYFDSSRLPLVTIGKLYTGSDGF
jgi:hypothetical protein